MKNAELSYCNECRELSTAEFDEVLYARCGSCGCYNLIDMSDGCKFIPVMEGED